MEEEEGGEREEQEKKKRRERERDCMCRFGVSVGLDPSCHSFIAACLQAEAHLYV